MGKIPFLLFPIPKDYIWGGRRLIDEYCLNFSTIPLAEAWVCSTHPDGESYLQTGKTLTSYFSDFPESLGTHSLMITDGEPELPILIKLIDAKKDLSVQVHPDDGYAALHEDGSFGKTELWYVLDAKVDSHLVYGFNRDVTKAEVRTSIEDGTIKRLLNSVPVHKNDVFMVDPGTVHAIGAGTLVAEIQESSNITYRLYDYDRIDKEGIKRDLHIDKALDVLNLNSSIVPRQPMRVLKYRSGCATELLGRCRYFQVERMILNTEIQRKLVDYKTESNSFHALLCIDGCGSISGNVKKNNQENSFFINFFKGDCIFIPAESIPLKLHGRAQILDVSC